MTKLVSFSVTSLFTKVPVQDLLDFFDKLLTGLFISQTRKCNLKIINLRMKDFHFDFNGNYFSKEFGMDLANPLSSFLSNLYMDFF